MCLKAQQTHLQVWYPSYGELSSTPPAQLSQSTLQRNWAQVPLQHNWAQVPLQRNWAQVYTLSLTRILYMGKDVIQSSHIPVVPLVQCPLWLPFHPCILQWDNPPANACYGMCQWQLDQLAPHLVKVCGCVRSEICERECYWNILCACWQVWAQCPQ